MTTAILSTKKDQITPGAKESLTRRIQEYPTEPLDKIPARQAEFELAGKKKHWLVSWLGNLLENLVLGKKSNQQTKTTKTKTLGPKRRPHGPENEDPEGLRVTPRVFVLVHAVVGLRNTPKHF